MTQGDLAALSAAEIVALVKTREISPVEVVEAALDRIERCNPTLNAVVTLKPTFSCQLYIKLLTEREPIPIVILYKKKTRKSKYKNDYFQ